MLKLLIAEDERDVADIVSFGARLVWPGSQVTIAEDGEEALKRFKEVQPDLVVLDINMPPPDGFEVCRRIRETSQVPILMLTARQATLDKVHALDIGADDYLTKPFDHLELIARLRALWRRASFEPTPEVASTSGVGSAPIPVAGVAQDGTQVATGQQAATAAEDGYQSGDLVINYGTREVRLQGELVPLTSTEYKLLEVLSKHAGNVLPHRYLLERVWGPEYTSEDHYLKVFIRRLRAKLQDSTTNPRYIQTDWGRGYRFVPQSR